MTGEKRRKKKIDAANIADAGEIVKEHGTLHIAKDMYGGAENRHLYLYLYNTERFPYLFLDEISLPVYGKDMEPVHLQVKSRKNNPKVAKKNGISAEIRNCDDDLAYPIEELIEEEKEVLEDIRSGRTPAYHTAEDMFEALNRELDCER